MKNFRDELGFRKDYPFKGINCTSFENVCQAVWEHCSNNDNGHVCLATHKCGCNSASDCPVNEKHIQGICERNVCKYANNCGNIDGDTYLCASGYCCTYDLIQSGQGECIEEGSTYTSNGESGICVVS